MRIRQEFSFFLALCALMFSTVSAVTAAASVMFPAVASFMAAMMMTAHHVRIILQTAVKKRFHRIIRAAGYTAVQTDTCIGERILCAGADTAAD